VKLSRTALGLTLLLGAAAALAFWTFAEARRQREEIEIALREEASLLAATLGPGLAAASDALLEIDDAIASRLLDSARLLAELARDADPPVERLRALAGESELDTIAYLEADGRIRSLVGDPLEPGIDTGLERVLTGAVDEVVYGPDAGSELDHRAAAVRLARGGAVLVHVHSTSAYAFARRLGPENLLRRLVTLDSVLYLAYREEPGPLLVEATWDGGALPPLEVASALVPVRGRLAFETSVPVETPAGRSASLRVGLDGTSIARASSAATRRTLLVGVALAAFGLASVAFALVRRERDRERVAAARRLAEAEEARRRSERLAIAGALAAGLAHEVRSPLNAIGLAAQRLERAHPDEAARGFARLARAEVGRLDGVLREFLGLARPVSDRRERTELGALGREVAELLAAEAAQAGVTIAPGGGAAHALVDREAVRRALINLLRNAIQASPAGATVRIEVGDGAAAGGGALLRVIDEGRGLDAELRERVLEPFVTTRADGTGLGLAIVRRIAEEHGGAFELADREPRGAVATLTLPRSEAT